MQQIPVGISTKYGIIFSVVAALKPVIDQTIALVENTSAQWSTGDKVGLVAAGGVGIAVILSRGAQAVAAIIRAGK